MAKQRHIQSIGPLILKNYSFLKNLCRTKSNKKRCGLLNNASREQLLSLVEVCSNILSDNFQLSKRQKARLIPHANTIRRLARARSERGAKKIIREQTGSGAPAVFASLLAPVIVEAAQHLISKVFKGRKSNGSDQSAESNGQ